MRSSNGNLPAWCAPLPPNVYLDTASTGTLDFNQLSETVTLVAADGVTVVGSIDDAVAAAGEASEVMVIGGAEVYRQAWPRLARVELTRVHASPRGDTRLEGVDWSAWQAVSTERHPADERNEYDYSFVTLTRRD